ncbi:hypothetical protein AJ80_06656 [Polytolypa hystricis UAMH7299]|uniref:Uncharacterized protein n=1 Tax=Polytolypa hystricis (strain UAMH7299) TaxID=1447883 RepID=A0A2B7XVL2_POLH7|nr:hypothetical protein AJ80_06656 [Polytolypa hystricis UAMH7299]
MATDTIFDNSQNSTKASILYKRALPPEDGHDPLDRLLQSAQQQAYVEHSKKRLGNEEGFSVMDILKKIEDDMLEIKSSIKVIEGEHAVIKEELSYLTGRPIIQRWKVLDARRISYRNRLHKGIQTATIHDEIAYGGDMLGDIKTIQYVQDISSRSSEYKEDFHQAYGIPFDEALVKVPSWPHKVERAFDIRASLHDLHAWQARDSRSIIQQQATQIIEAALSTENDQLQARFQDGGDLQEIFIEMDLLFVTRGVYTRA